MSNKDIINIFFINEITLVLSRYFKHYLRQNITRNLNYMKTYYKLN